MDEIYQQFEIQDSSEISSVTLTEITVLMGFVQQSNNDELDMV